VTQIQQGRYDALLRRVADLKGPGSKVNDVLEELFPVIDVERVPGELLNLMGTDICWGSESRTAPADNFSRIQVFNPEGSGKLITVTSVIITTLQNQVIRYSIVDVALATETTVNRFRDSRRGLDSNPVGQIRNAALITITPDAGQFLLLATTPYTLDDSNSVAVLSPGFGLEVGAETAQTTIKVTFNWRERVAEPSELNI